MKSPEYKLAAAVVVGMIALLGGYFHIITASLAQTLIAASAAYLFGYSSNGFGQLKSVPQLVEKTISTGVAQAIQPLMDSLALHSARLDALDGGACPQPAGGPPAAGDN